MGSIRATGGPAKAGAPPPTKTATQASSPRKRTVYTPGSLLDQWAEEGPLVHEPTGLHIDDLTDGGPTYGTRWYLLGAPDACKTALLIQIAHVYALRGVVIGLLGIDEEPTDLLGRLLQRCGFTRRQCEERDPVRLAKMREVMRELEQLIRFYDLSWTIEAAADDLAAAAKRLGKRAALFSDSVQTIACAAAQGDDDMTERALVSANVRALRAKATEHRVITITTSEMNRAAYRSIQDAEASKRTGDIAAGKETGAIEYSGRVILSLRHVEGSPDRFEVGVAKNKHGPRGDKFYLRLDRSTMTLTHDAAPSAEERERAKTAGARAANARNAARVAAYIAAHPGVKKNELHAGLRAEHGAFGEKLADVAVRALGDAIYLQPLPNRASGHHLDGRKVPGEILKLITDPTDRSKVEGARWPGPAAVVKAPKAAKGKAA
jgi:KaiC/GvpD/RAD55 family RecA-like ATPase